MKTILKYYSAKFTRHVNMLFLINRNRAKGNYIGSNCIISRDTILFGNNKINYHSRIGGKVELKSDAIVRNHCCLSRITVGENSIIDSHVKCVGHAWGKINIGKESYIGINNILDHSQNIEIGDYVHIAGSSTCLWTHSTAQACLDSVPIKNLQKETVISAPIIIENNVYIGGNCTIYPGVRIQHHSIISPNSVVTKDVPPNTMMGGVPAKYIKDIN